MPRILAGGMDTRGYRHYALQRDGGTVTRLAHSLVAAAFIGPRPPVPPGEARIEVRHMDGNRTNNHAANLRYGTSRQNTLDSIEHGTHTSLAQKAQTHCKRGHEYTPENTAIAPSGKGVLVRNCRKCRVLRNTAARLGLKMSELDAKLSA